MTPRDRTQPPSGAEIRRIRADLDKRTPEKVAADEKGARKAVDRNARDEGEKGTFLGFLFGGKK